MRPSHDSSEMIHIGLTIMRLRLSRSSGGDRTSLERFRTAAAQFDPGSDLYTVHSTG